MRKAAHFIVVITGLIFFTGCGGGYYKPQAVISPPTEGQEETQARVMVRVKPLRDFECSYYFDNRLVSRGIQPIQLFVENDSDSYYVLDAEDISFELLGKKDVGAVLYKNIFGRSLVWLVGTVAVFWKVFLPIFIVDTLLCLQANKEMSNDISSLSVNPKEKIVIAPHSRIHKVLFVSADSYYHHLALSLTEQETEKKLRFRF